MPRRPRDVYYNTTQAKVKDYCTSHNYRVVAFRVPLPGELILYRDGGEVSAGVADTYWFQFWQWREAKFYSQYPQERLILKPLELPQ